MSLLVQVRELLKAGNKYALIAEDGSETEDIVKAQTVSFTKQNQNKDDGPLNFQLDETTEFEIDGTGIPLRVVIHCWLHKDSSAADYLADCQNKQLSNVSFLQRTDLLNWLSGATEVSQYVKLSNSVKEGEDNISANDDKTPKEIETKVSNAQSEGNKTTGETSNVNSELDPVVADASSHERVLLDHNSSLRGSKVINFGYLIKDAELKLVQSIKSSLRSKKSAPNGTSHGRVSKNHTSKTAPRKDPIILIPSAASSLFTIANIKQFLQDSQYINPRDLSASQTDLVTVEKKFDRLARPVRFMIVNNTRMFTKPEYWDRVVAVVTMGHTWQFNNYQWNTPQELFQHCKGYYFHFTGDAVPQHVQQWNVQKIELDKSKRFKDVEVARFFWNSLEKELIARGFH